MSEIFRWVKANAYWRVVSLRALLTSRPWTGFVIFVLVFITLGQVVVFVWFFGDYASNIVATMGPGAARLYSTPLFLWASAFTLIFGAVEFRPGVARFWVIESSPAPASWRSLDRAASTYTLAAFTGMPLFLAAAHAAGYPLWGGLSLFAWVVYFAMQTRRSPILGILLSGGLGFLFGWFTAYTFSQVLSGNLLSSADAGGFEGMWALFKPLILMFPMPAGLAAFLNLPGPVHVAGVAGAAFAAARIQPRLGARVTRVYARLLRYIGHLQNTKLALALVRLLSRYQASLAGAAAYGAYVLASRWFPIPRPPLGLTMWILVAVAVSPLFNAAMLPVFVEADRSEVGSVIDDNLGAKGPLRVLLLRGGLELMGAGLFPFVFIPSLWPAAAVLVVWLAVVWGFTPFAQNWPPQLVLLVVTMGGVGALWIA